MPRNSSSSTAEKEKEEKKKEKKYQNLFATFVPIVTTMSCRILSSVRYKGSQGE